MNKARVFVPYNPHRLDRDRNELVPKFDLDPARSHGEIVFLLSPNVNPLGPGASKIADDLHKGLAGIDETDSLLLIGNPAIIALTAAVAAHYTGGRLRMLQWRGPRTVQGDRVPGDYEVVELDVN